MSLATADELSSMLHEPGEWFSAPGGRKFRARWEGPSSDSLDTRSKALTLLCREADVEHVETGARVARLATNKVYVIRAREPFGVDSMTVLTLEVDAL